MGITSVSIGARPIVMVAVEAGTTVGAGSVVVKSIPEGSVAVGSPARVVQAADREPHSRYCTTTGIA